MSKRHLANWFRRGANMRDLNEITVLLRGGYDLLFDSIYCNVECTIYNKYLHTSPTYRDQSRVDVINKTRGINNIDLVRFANKTGFFKRFVKGTRSLLK